MAAVQTTCKTKSSENKTRPDLKKSYEVYDHSTSGTEDGRSFTESVFIQPGWTKGDEMVYTGLGPIFSSNSETLICVFSVSYCMSFKPSQWLRLGMRVGSCGPGELSPFNSKVEMGQHLENTHSYPMMPGSPCPGVLSSAGATQNYPHPWPQFLLCWLVWHFILAWVV